MYGASDYNKVFWHCFSPDGSIVVLHQLPGLQDLPVSGGHCIGERPPARQKRSRA